MEVLQKIFENGLVGIIRGVHPEDILQVANALYNGGIHTLEITVDTPRVLHVIERLRNELPEEVIVGAGTVLDAETARAVIMAGSQFIFSPTVNIDTIQITKRYGIVSIPGAMTPTEILTAYETGGDVIKVFPSRAIGPDYIKDIKGPLPHIPLMPTGGVAQHNIMDYFKAGAVAVGLGGSLVQAKDKYSQADLAELTRKARAYRQILQQVRNGKERNNGEMTQ
ncbi:bifunctional 4-hydroxy-2-oxoglutarate aldolase/2-dehydro-3-deoxy-phosphogluconate aldolase [Gracilibacillus xinjiangensis]|uniref:Bifunctional 4-hydroxy-2-oxoglutarate aldolase/2-dehydro-3-deoxy-phosphogluconate aldolase n=1 Tax=Gracilibacillus xinjiangensis TaxID=1193282 RepID=A0ABV8WU09_9BACI